MQGVSRVVVAVLPAHLRDELGEGLEAMALHALLLGRRRANLGLGVGHRE